MTTLRRCLAPLASLLSLLALSACSGGVDGPGPAAEPEDTGVSMPWTAPDAPGPWIAGTWEDELVGRTGESLVVQVWFPASEADEDLYMYNDVLAFGAHDDGVPDCRLPRPVVVFSHGYSAVRFQSVFLTEHLAAHGWVVVAPDHTGNTLYDLDQDRDGEVGFRRPWDVADSFDWLLGQGASGGPLEGCIDPDAGYAVVGHSFGGWTSLMVAGATVDVVAADEGCAGNGAIWCDVYHSWRADNPEDVVGDLSDPRAWASVPMSPGGLEVMGEGLANIDIPILIMGGTKDDLTPWDTQVAPMYDLLTASPRALAGVVDAGHYTPSDVCSFLPIFDDCVGEEGGWIDPDHGKALFSTTAGAFLRVQQGDEEAAAWLPPDDPAVPWTAEP